MTMQIIFKEQIKRYRAEQGLTQKQLANVLNVSEQTISNWEGGHNVLPFAGVEDIAKKLKVTAEWLLFGIIFAEAEVPTEIGYQVPFVQNHIVTAYSNNSEFNEITIEQRNDTSLTTNDDNLGKLTLPIIFATQIKRLRSESGLTAEEFSKGIASLNKGKLGNYELGLSFPTLENISKLAEELHVTQEYLLFGITSAIAEIPASVKIDVNNEPNRDVFISATRNGLKTVEYSEFTKSHGSTLPIKVE